MPFSKGDPRINRKGRPKKGSAIAEILREILEEQPVIDPKTKELKLKKSKSPDMKRVFAESLVIRAIRSNAAARILLHYVDGLPVQTVRQVGDGALSRIEIFGRLSRADLEGMKGVEGQDKRPQAGEEKKA